MQRKFIVCAGHSNTDPGAVAGKYKEADLTLWLRNEVARTLTQQGYTVYTDGTQLDNDTLKDAIQLLKEHPDALAVEFHFNAGPPSASGVECISHKPLSSVAQLISYNIAKVTGTPIRGRSGWKCPKESQHKRLGFCDNGGIIVEVEFISNFGAMLKYEETKYRVASAIVDAIITPNVPNNK